TRGLAQLASAQNQYNVLDLPREEGVLEACERHGMKLLPFYPLASGLLTGKYEKGKDAPPDSRLAADTRIGERFRKRNFSDERFDKIAKLDAFAKERGHTLLELAFSWLASQ